MILLFLLPFYDRGPERRPERRPIATTAGIATIAAMAFLTYQGASAGSPTAIEAPTPKAVLVQGGKTLEEYEAGKLAVAQSGCEACHKIGDNGNSGPGPNLTHIGSRLHQRGDRADARQPDSADAVVQEPAARQVQRDRQFPLSEQIARRRPLARGSARERCSRNRCGRCSTASHACTTR